jgi:hypothetical protein
MVDVVARREGLDLGEQGILHPPRQHQMAEHPVPTDNQLGEGHADMKGDPGLLRHVVTGPKLSSMARNAS